ncbi:DUF3322 domain-containing protein [Coraliomargarita sp. SDUM461003]|uniref:DUF3322 domain-containing protein n=1 Tax=Thalassobacterium maritimum TaxID=3041265 RepID=A0ABU1AZ71_9BACT|nr:DUF3322 domain-containing protein [Coraliomargarita sp. SDUM461003]MDQ8208430.1 DUF3322 domain-containing protein [Coraliomargarita sp. SDUM461003]
MKTPDQLRAQLIRQWENASLREERLLNPEVNWPIRLSIGKPTAHKVEFELDAVRAHIQQWQAMPIEQVEWTSVRYRSTAEPIQVPVQWLLQRPSDWAQASEDERVYQEYQTMAQLCAESPASDHSLWIRKRHLWRDKPIEEVLRAVRLANSLKPGCADGRPLRALSYAGIDSKFFERHRTLIIQLLDVRYDGAASDLGLETLLEAAPENDHWLLVADLDGELLPFAQQRVRASELASRPEMPGSHYLIVENERALHLLPPLSETLVVLGSGNNLKWLANSWLSAKHVAYWGDLDTWGLKLLAQARAHLPQIRPLLMDSATFAAHAPNAVVEPLRAVSVKDGLTSTEQKLFNELTLMEKGRLEQEFLTEASVHGAVTTWRNQTI